MTEETTPELRINVTSGSPNATEIAAVAAVVTGIAAQGSGVEEVIQEPAWLRATRLEAVGSAPVARPQAIKLYNVTHR